MRDTSTHPPPKLRQRNRESGAKPPERRRRYSQGVAGLEQFRGRGHRWRPPRLRTPGAPAAAARRGAWMSELRAARQGRGSAGAPDLRCSALGARPPEPQPQREPGSGQKARSAAVAAAAKEAPAPQAARASLAAAAADTCWPGPRPIRGARGGGACGGGAGAPAGRPAGEAVRARACAGAEGCPPGRFLGSSPGARAARAGRGGAHREEAGLGLRAPGAGIRAHSWALPSGAVQCWGQGLGAPQARPQVTPIFEVRFFLSPAPEPGHSLTAE